MDNLGILTTDIRHAFEKKEFLIATFLDINAAYDNVRLDVLRETLLSINIPPLLTNLIHNMLAERTIVMTVGRDSNPIQRKIYKGLPQGSVISPILFNIYCSQINSVVQSDCKILQYADDIVLYSSHNSLNIASNNLGISVASVNDWLLSRGVCLSPTKCQTVVFTKRRKFAGVNITINDISIPYVKEVKFLGMILDSKLSWRHHIDLVLAKCEKSINILRSVCRVWWGCHPKTMKILYNALVRSHLDYGSFLMDPLPKYQQAKLELVQSKCLRLILGAMRSSPINTLQVECVDMPLHIRRRYLADNFVLKRIGLMNSMISDSVSALNSHKGYNEGQVGIPNLSRGFLSISRFDSLPPRMEVLPYYDTPFEAISFIPQIVFNTGIVKGVTNKEYVNEKFTEFTSNYPSHTHIFTDGSKFPNTLDVGVGIYVPQLKMKLAYKIPGPASVFTAECIAIREGLNMLTSLNFPNFILFTDSLSALKAISSNLNRRPFDHIICEIKKILFTLHTHKKDIILTWIPSHRGIRGNEVVDDLAKQAVVDGIVPAGHFSSLKDLTLKLKTMAFASWSEEWEVTGMTKGKHYKQLQPVIPTKPWFSKMYLPKPITSMLCRMRIGHCLTTEHLHKIGLSDSPYCECGIDIDTLEHTFFVCPIISDSSLYDSIGDIPRPFNMSLILTLKYRKAVRELSKFIKVTNLRI
jgi:ribonuclease HI